MTSRSLTIAGYLAVVAALVVVAVAAHRQRTGLPTIGEVFSKLSARRVGRVTVMLAWWWLGWHFFVR